MQHVTLVEECSLDKWNEMIAINLTAPFYLCKHLIPKMKQKGNAINEISLSLNLSF